MSFLNRILGSLRKRSALDQDIEDEQRHHLELAAKDLEREGVDPQEARRLAAVRFGSRIDSREETRNQDLLPWLDTLGRDLLIACRVFICYAFF